MFATLMSYPMLRLSCWAELIDRLLHSKFWMAGSPEEIDEDQWTIWGRIVNDWDDFKKKREKQLKVRYIYLSGGFLICCSYKGIYDIMFTLLLLLWFHWDYQFFQDLVRHGIPHHFRGIVWQLLCGAHRSPIKDQYVDLLKKVSPSEKLIKRDIARTYPENEFFKGNVGQEVLFNVTKVGHIALNLAVIKLAP